MPKQYAVALLLSMLAQIAVAGPVRLVTGDDLPPYTGKKLAQGGMLTEVVQRAFAAGRQETTLAWAPWKRGYEMTKLGDYDATFPYARMPERENEYLFSHPVYGGVRGVYARADSGIDPTRPETFHGLTYCAPSGFIVYPKMEALLKGGAVKMERPPSLVACAKMVMLGRVDFFITDSIVGDEILQQAGVASSVVRLVKPFDRAEFYLIVPKSRPDAEKLIAGFNGGLKRLKASGEYDRIIKRHLH
jgi:polar amino acid transport system substrate-binding protein